MYTVIINNDVNIVLEKYENPKTKLYKCYNKNKIDYYLQFNGELYNIDSIYESNSVLSIYYTYYNNDEELGFEHYFKPKTEIIENNTYKITVIFEKIYYKGIHSKKRLCIIWEDFM